MTMKTHSQRSISDLEQTIKHKVLSHQSDHSNASIEANHLIQSKETLSVYCDCSVVNGCFHLGVCIVGLGMCRLYGTSLATQTPQYNILGELHALRFAVGCTRDFLATYGAGNVHSVCVFSDVDHIEQFLRANSGRAHKSIRKSVRRLRRSMKHFNKQFTGRVLSVRYVGKPDERNLYCQSAHLVARRVAVYENDSVRI
jgi:hypothetical protein